MTGQTEVDYTYDNANRLTAIAQGSSTVTLGYDAANHRTVIGLPNGITGVYTYDEDSHLTGISYTLGGSAVGDLSYSYDVLGRRITAGGSLSATGFPASLSSTTFNADNELTNFGGATISYDANGNMTDDSLHAYSWDARNQLASIDSGSTGAFVYDPFGRRVSKSISGGSATSFLYDGANMVQEIVSSTPTANLLTGNGVDEYFTRTDSSGARNLLTDALGSTLALADSSGVLQTLYSYDPYGNTTSNGASNSNAFQYTARENDGTGLYFLRARYYSPNLQRFISQDPAGLSFAPNLYPYTNDSPINFTDPLGLWTVSIGGTVSVSWGFFSFQYSGGFVVDGQGNIGVYNTLTPFPGGAFGNGGIQNVGNYGGSGYPYSFPQPRPGSSLGGGWHGGLGLSLAGSNAQNICDLSGPFVNGSAGLGAGADANVDGFAGTSRHGTVIGGGATIGAGAGESGSIAITNTWITPLAGRKTACPN